MPNFDLLEEQQLELQEKQKKVLLEKYLKAYEPEITKLHNDSILSRARKITPDDVITVCNMFEQYRAQEQFLMNEALNGSVADLGKLPIVAYDVILGFYGGSVIPLIASQQKLSGSQGYIYFKDIQASNTRGNVTANQYLNKGDAAPDVYADGYAHSRVENEVLLDDADFDGVATNFTPTIASAPLKPGSVNMVLSSDTGATIQDDSNGKIISDNGTKGTINYETGAVNITFDTAPADTGVDLKVNYSTLFEEDGSFPLMQPKYRQTLVKAQTFVLGQKLGLFENFEMMQTLGRDGTEDMVQDLTNELLAQVSTRLIKQYEAQGIDDSIVFDADAGTTDKYLHRLNLKFSLSAASNKITDNAGRGIGNVWIAGSNACTYIENLPGFKHSGVHTVGAHFFGTYNGITVIKAPMINTNRVLVTYKGTDGFDAAGVHGTYMPLTVLKPTDRNNELQTRGVCAHWGSTDVVNPRFINVVNITNSEI